MTAALAAGVLLMAPLALGQNQLTGLTVITNEDPVGDPPFNCHANIGLDICNVFAQFNGPNAQVMGVGSANITTTAEWSQHPLGGDGPPPCFLIPLFPDVQCDSFVTVKLTCDPGSGSLIFDPDFIFGATTLTGGWFTDPQFSQGIPDANDQVLLMQLAVPTGADISGTFSIFWQETNPTGPVVESPAQFACFTPGAVPDGRFVAGLPLTLAKSGASQLNLSWGPSCSPSGTDYEVYEGTIGTFTSHNPRLCSTAGATGAIIAPASGSRYYLVVPTSGSSEGSYGKRSDGLERPASAGACQVQALGECL